MSPGGQEGRSSAEQTDTRAQGQELAQSSGRVPLATSFYLQWLQCCLHPGSLSPEASSGPWAQGPSRAAGAGGSRSLSPLDTSSAVQGFGTALCPVPLSIVSCTSSDPSQHVVLLQQHLTWGQLACPRLLRFPAPERQGHSFSHSCHPAYCQTQHLSHICLIRFYSAVLGSYSRHLFALIGIEPDSQGDSR